MDDEVEHISADNLRAAGFNESELLQLEEDLTAYAKSHGDPFLLVPFMRRSVSVLILTADSEADFLVLYFSLQLCLCFIGHFGVLVT